MTVDAQFVIWSDENDKELGVIDDPFLHKDNLAQFRTLSRKVPSCAPDDR